MLYLAHPYWSPDSATRKARVAAVQEAATSIIKLHFLYPLASLPFSYALDEAETFGREYWLHYSLRLLQRADAVLVLPFAGWLESEGLRRELFVARGLGLSIYSPAQYRLPLPKEESLHSPAWHGGPEFIEGVNK